jgi:GH15 family glucan-1,4-alpha-glucosidase
MCLNPAISFQPIESHGVIGDMHTVALVTMDGSIDWWCYPDFDSPSIFGSILDSVRGGYFRIDAQGDQVARKQLYWPGTNILVTRFLLREGIAEVEDFMPVGDSRQSRCICRRVRCVKGKIRISLSCRPAFNYGRDQHETQVNDAGAIFKSTDMRIALRSAIPLTPDDRNGVSADFVLSEGEAQAFLVSGESATDTTASPRLPEEAEELFKTTVRFWQKWLSGCTYQGRWREQVLRSALALKLLTFEPTGAIIAAPTTSLPEVIGGARNWDYRYTWIRDAAFTVYAFLRIGFKAEAAAFFDWLRDYVARHASQEDGDQLRTMYTIHGEDRVSEETLDHWEGYRRSQPVRIGNAAVLQFQNDIYGELLDSCYLYNKYVAPIPYDVWVRIRSRLNWVCEHWQDPDAGIWEMRHQPQHFVYSKVMNWVALDRGIRLADKRSFPADRGKWVQERDRIYEEVMTRGWSQQRRAFTQFYGSQDLDASLLIMPLVFFVAPNDPRMLSTIEAILQSPSKGGLVSDGLVYRYPPQPRIDGLPGEEGTFNMCSFWLVEALTRAGHTSPEYLDRARLLFERMLGYANHVGLYAEQTGPQGEALGNFPQAFTHLALISAAFNLDRALG